MSQSGQEGGQTDGEQTGQQGNGTGTDSAQGTGNGGGTGADSEQHNSGTDTGNTTTVSQEDFNKLKNQLSEADRKRTAAEQELQKLKDKDLSEKEKAVKDLQTVTEERDSLVGEVHKLRLANAFLSANTIAWNDPEVALEIAGSKGYLEDAVSDKGEVDSKELAKALDKLSKDKPYLVKAKDDDGEEEEEKQPPSGAPAGGAGKGKKDDAARLDRLKQTLPALGRR